MVEERIDGKTMFNQPAGHLEPGETLSQAAQRETLEETGWEVEITDFLGLYHYVSDANSTCYVRSCFVGRPVGRPKGRRLDKDILAAHWFTFEEIERRRAQLRSPAVLQGLLDYRTGIRFPLSIITTL